MADEQGKLSDRGGNHGFLLGTMHIIFTKCSLSCDQHFCDYRDAKISMKLFLLLNL